MQIEHWQKLDKGQLVAPESTANTSRSIASALTKGDIKNWENLHGYVHNEL